MSSAKRTFLFHIGLPKTGSTSIQHALVALADELAARGIRAPYDRALYGSQFPNPGAPKGAPQTDGFVYFFKVRERRPDSHVFWQDAVEKFVQGGDADTFVISHENMSQAGTKLREDRFAAIAEHGDIRFLVYLRHPLSFLNSYCLQLIYGLGAATPRAVQPPVARYLATGYAGLLAPFEKYGQVDARNFDELRKDGQLVPDFLAAIGADDLAEQAGRLERLNTKGIRFNLACVSMALKIVAPVQEKPWFALRRILWAAGEALEAPMQTSFLPAALAQRISDRWDEDRAVISKRYGVHFDEAPDFKPGPETLSFSAQYGAALQAAAAPELSQSQQDWLAQALELAGEDLEQVLLRPKSKPGTTLPPENPTTGDVIMTEETRTRPEIAHEDAIALAKAMFRVQNKKGDADSGEDRASFKDAKGDLLPLARRTLKILHNQGYTLTKAAE